MPFFDEVRGGIIFHEVRHTMPQWIKIVCVWVSHKKKDQQQQQQ